ncbi:MAG: CoA-binding protein [Proteobacteria bacterium]|nr:CoA-binding protein [Pseudomonadota bacterium]
MAFEQNLITEWPDIEALLRTVRRVAVLGMKTEVHADQAAWYVPEALARAGVEIVPVPVYYPEVTHLMGQPVYRRLVDVPGDLDLVDIFRRPADVTGHVDDIIAKGPRIAWMQSGIRNDEAAEALARAGIKVVQNRCLMVDYGRVAR